MSLSSFAFIASSCLCILMCAASLDFAAGGVLNSRLGKSFLGEKFDCPCGLSGLLSPKQSRQYTGRSPFGRKGTWQVLPHFAHTASNISRWPPKSLLPKLPPPLKPPRSAPLLPPPNLLFCLKSFIVSKQ